MAQTQMDMTGGLLQAQPQTKVNIWCSGQGDQYYLVIGTGRSVKLEKKAEMPDDKQAWNKITCSNDRYYFQNAKEPTKYVNHVQHKITAEDKFYWTLELLAEEDAFLIHPKSDCTLSVEAVTPNTVELQPTDTNKSSQKWNFPNA